MIDQDAGVPKPADSHSEQTVAAPVCGGLGIGEGRLCKAWKETFEGDEYVHFLGYADGFTVHS